MADVRHLGTLVELYIIPIICIFSIFVKPKIQF